MKNKKVKIVLIIIFIIQLLIPVLFFYNEKYIMAKGELKRFNIDSLDVNLKNQVVQVQIHTTNTDKSINTAERFYEGLNKNKRLIAYEIYTYKGTDTSYLKVVDRKKIVDDNTLISNLCRTDIKQMPDNYIKGDKIELISRGMNIDKQIRIDAEIYCLNGAGIIKNIYINDIDYMEYINDNYYDLLIEQD